MEIWSVIDWLEMEDNPVLLHLMDIPSLSISEVDYHISSTIFLLMSR